MAFHSLDINRSKIASGANHNGRCTAMKYKMILDHSVLPELDSLFGNEETLKSVLLPGLTLSG